MFKLHDKVGIVCCSNAQKNNYKGNIEILLNTLKEQGLQPICSEFIYEKEYPFSGSAKERAGALMNFYRDKSIKAIFDISGGDLANELLPYLDYDIIIENYKPFFGYSDLTTILNAIYAKTEKESYLYQVRNLIYDCKDKQITMFQNSCFIIMKICSNFTINFCRETV